MKKVAEVKFLELQGMYLTTEQAAKYLGLSTRTLERMRRKGNSPAYIKRASDGKILYKRSELVAWYYRFGQTEVAASEAIIKVDNPLIDLELHLEGDKVSELAPNLEKAITNIIEEINKNTADGFLCFEYRFGGIKAQLHLHETKILSYAKYVFQSESRL